MTRRCKKVRFGDFNESTEVKTEPASQRSILKRPESVATNAQSLLSNLFTGAVGAARSEAEMFDLVKNAIILDDYRNFHDEDDGTGPPSLLEAYTVLNLCLKTREGAAEVAGDVRRIVQAVKRDFLILRSTDNILEVRIVVQIFRVIDGLLSAEHTASLIEAEYVRFFLGHAIEILASADSSKALSGVCIHLFTNLYYPKSLSSDLAVRLLSAIGERSVFPSVGLAAEYLTAYRMMLVHHRGMMATKVESWVSTLVHCLCDNNAFVRQQALLTLSECNRKLMCERSIAVAIADAFNEDVDGEPFGSIACQRLSGFLNSQGETRTIMSIWSNVLLALNGNPDEKVVNWPFVGKWMDICKQGLHSMYLSTKEAALAAWKTAIYMFAFDNRPEHFSRNLQPLVHPFKTIRGNTPPVLLKRYYSLLHALLYIGLRTLPPPQASYDLIWSNVVAPVMHNLFASGSAEARMEGTNILNSIVRSGQLSSPGPTPQRLRALGNDIELSEVGGFPTWWIKQNSNVVLDLLFQLQQDAGTADVLGVWQTMASICKQTLSSEIHESNESVNQVANLLAFLLKVPDTELLPFVTSVVETIGVPSLMSKRFSVDNQSISVVKTQASSAIAIILKLLFTRIEFTQAKKTFRTIIKQAGTFRRALGLLNSAAQIEAPESPWKICAEQACHELHSHPGDLEGDDLDNVLGVLSALPPLESGTWELWAELFTTALKAHGKNEPFVNFLSRQNPSRLNLSALLGLKAGPLCNRNEFNTAVVRAATAQPDVLLHLDIDLSVLPSSFRIQLARQLVSATCNSSIADFSQVLNLADQLIDDDDQVANADVFVTALRSSLDDHKRLAAEKWNALFGDASVDVRFSDAVVAAINHLYLNEELEIRVPPAIELLPTSMGSSSPHKRLNFPNSSPPQSPTESLMRFKRRRVGDTGESQMITPPNSSDMLMPGSYAMDLFNRLHDTSDPVEIEDIREKHSMLAKPRPVRLLSEMNDLCSSPPRMMSEEGNERSKEVGMLKSALMRSDLRRNLRKGVTKSECQLLEKLLMDSLVSIRIHMANQAD